MRIIRLYWENVNSLAGAYEIDFSAPEFRANGLFAITGPMGSGKTSILDAVTIALFGKTARSSPYERKHDREDDCMFMTKGRARCEAKIVFESKGRLYCSRWSRGTTKTGRLKSPEVELGTFDVMEDLETKSIRILAEKKTEWDAAVEAALGMTYDVFMRSVLLAQGAFSGFLRAKPDDRAAMLERITGTEIYSNISRIVFERAKAEGAALADARRRIDEVEVLEAAERLELQNGAADLEGRVKTLSDGLERLRTKIQERENEAKLSKELESRESALELKTKDMECLRERLDAVLRAEKAAPILQANRSARRAAEALRQLEESAKKAEETALRHAEDLRGAVEEVERFSAAFNAAKEARKAFEPVRAEALEADARIEAHERAALEASKDAEAGLRALEAAQTAHREAEIAALGAEKALKGVKAPLTDAVRTELERCAFELRAAAKSERGMREAHQKAVRGLDARCREAQEAKRNEQTLRRHSEARREAHQASLQRYGEALRRRDVLRAGGSVEARMVELRQAEGRAWASRWAAAAALEKGEAERMLSRADLPEAFARYAEDVRRRAEHALEAVAASYPEFCAGADLCEFDAALAQIASIEGAGRTIDEADRLLEAARSEAEALAEAAKKSEEAADAAKERSVRAEEAERAAREGVKTAEANLCSARSALIKILEQPSLTGFERATPEEALDALERSLDEDRRSRDEAARLREAVAEAQKKLAGARSALEAARTASEKAAKRSALESETWRRMLEARRLRWGDLDPAARAAELLLQEEKAESELKAVTKRRDELLKEAGAIREKSAESRTRADAQRRMACESLRTYQSALEASDFADENALLQAELPPETCLAVREAHRRAETELARARGMRDDLRRRHAQAEVLVRGLPPLDALRAELGSGAARLSELQRRLGEMGERLRRDQEAQKKREELVRLAGERLRTAELWEELNGLIGSAKGDQFRRIAQRMTFSALLKRATKILKAMDGRYELTPSGANGLDVSVLDLDLAEAVRTSANLSGGETFIVSLALALALAGMNAQGGAIGTLFLDEGFGSLDGASLEKALGALESLQRHSGRLVGIISHVESVRDRVPVHISVRKGASGESSVKGPGVRRVSVS